jgi:hypothetical protein
MVQPQGNRARGRTVVKLRLVNNSDQILAAAGAKPAAEVRRDRRHGAAIMVLPAALAA